MTILHLLKHPINDCTCEEQLSPHRPEVLRRWALRVARDVEDYDDTGAAKRCNDVLERFLNGKATEEELEVVRTAAHSAAYSTAYSTAHYASYSAHSAAHYGHASPASPAQAKKKYHGWLIEMIVNDTNDLASS